MFEILSQSEISSLLITLKLGAFVVILSHLIGIPLAWFLIRTKSKLTILLETILTMPIVLPPTVLGFYFLITLKGADLAFSFLALVLASTVVGLPFVLQTLKNSFNRIGNDQWETALTLRATKIDAFFTIIIPQSRNGILSSVIICFAQTLGHFGLLLMVGGNLPSKTKVLSISIYESVEMLNYEKAHSLSLLMVVIAFVCILMTQFLNSSKSKL